MLALRKLMSELDVIVEVDFASSVIFFLCQEPAGVCWMHFAWN